MGDIRDSSGKWLNTSVFREAAIRFEKYRTYCSYPVDSIDYDDFWEEELRRCREGYEVQGHRITKHHYFYLNYGWMKKGTGSNSAKVFGLPDFTDWDYEFFWLLEIAQKGISEEELEKLQLKTKPKDLSGGNHLILSKARRKGYSYKGAAVATNTYNSVRGSNCLIVSYAKGYSQDCFNKAVKMMAHLDKHTAWAKKREKDDRSDHKKASFYEEVNGVRTEQGYFSEISTHTCKDNADVLRGKDANIILFEESGKNKLFEATLEASKDCVTDGDYTTGTIIAWGTGGSQESDSMDFADLCYNPTKHNFLPFYNQWDADTTEDSECGFFHPDNGAKQGFYDEQGNSDEEGAAKDELDRWERIKKQPNGSKALIARMAEHPLRLQHSFIIKDGGDFPVQELQAQLNRVKANPHLRGTPCKVWEEGGEVRVKPDLEGKLVPINSYTKLPDDKTGAVVIWEHPIEGAPFGMYKMGYDPYRQDQSKGDSLGAVYVYKSMNTLAPTGDRIVACYVGRPRTTDDFDRQVLLLARYYNANVMHENEVTTVKKYFERTRYLHHLALKPQSVIDANVKKNTTRRQYGIHMVSKLKDAGEKYIKKWLLTERDSVDGKAILNLEVIYDIGLLEELIRYNRGGNFDRVMAMMCLVFLMEDEDLEVYEELNDKHNIVHELAEQMAAKYNR